MTWRAYAALTGSTSSEGRVSGYVLKVIRECTGHTQEQLAESLGAGVATIQGWESGRRPLMAMSAGNFVALRTRLRRLGAEPGLLATLTQGWKSTCSSARPLRRHTGRPTQLAICSAPGCSHAHSPRWWHGQSEGTPRAPSNAPPAEPYGAGQYRAGQRSAPTSAGTSQPTGKP